MGGEARGENSLLPSQCQTQKVRTFAGKEKQPFSLGLFLTPLSRSWSLIRRLRPTLIFGDFDLISLWRGLLQSKPHFWLAVLLYSDWKLLLIRQKEHQIITFQLESVIGRIGLFVWWVSKTKEGLNEEPDGMWTSLFVLTTVGFP